MKTLYVLFSTFLFANLATSVPVELDPRKFNIVTDMDTLGDLAADLDSLLSSRLRTVGQVVEGATIIPRSLCNDEVYAKVAERSGENVAGFCWDESDNDIQAWWPQGVTTSFDAYIEGVYDNHTIILNSWYHKPEEEGTDILNKGIRISFMNYDNNSANAYEYVLIVEPTEDGNFKAIPIHAGGIMWYGNLLYVVHTWNGIRIFDMDHIYEVDTDTNDTNLIGIQDDGKAYAHGYKYILPQIGTMKNTGQSLRYSFIALDRASTPESFIVGEYATGSETDNNTDIVRFPLNSTNYLPPVEDDGKTYAIEAYETGILQMQGALARDGRFWFSSSNFGGTIAKHYGHLRVWDRNTTEMRSYDWTYGSEDLSYWADPSGNSTIWSVTEFPRRRVVIGIPEAEWN